DISVATVRSVVGIDREVAVVSQQKIVLRYTLIQSVFSNRGEADCLGTVRGIRIDELYLDFGADGRNRRERELIEFSYMRRARIPSLLYLIDILGSRHGVDRDQFCARLDACFVGWAVRQDLGS